MNMTTQTIYGYCPQCGAIGLSRERRPNGNDKCANGHTYPSGKALSQPNEPVLYQWFDESTDEWIDTSEKYYEQYSYDNEVRKLYTSAPPNLEEANKLLEAKVKELELQLKDRESDLAFEFKRANESEGTALLASQKYVDYCDLAETKIAELTKQNQSLVDDVEILTAKCEKMQEALIELQTHYKDTHRLTQWNLINKVLEECK